MNIKCGYKSINGDYIFSKVSKTVAQFKKENPKIKVVDLGVGDVKSPPPTKISSEIVKQSKNFSSIKGFCGYPDESGIKELKKAISNYYKQQGACVLEEEIFITTGAKPAIGELFEICNFSKAFILTPTYPLYEELCLLHGVDIQFEKTINKGKIGLPTNKADVIFICSPNNPTGEVISSKRLKKYATYAKNHNSLVVLDGAYADFSKHYVCPYLLKNSQNIIEVRSYSKNLCFTGLRLGYMVIKKDNPIYLPYKRYLSLRSNGVNVIMQRAAVKAYSAISKRQEQKKIEEYRQNAKVLKEVFNDAGFYCKGGVNAPYLLVNVKENGEQFFKNLLNYCAVVVTPGEAFRATNCVRVSCLANKEDIKEGAKRLAEFFNIIQNKKV